MPQVVRLGDSSSHNGQMNSATGKFKVNGKRACVSGDTHMCPSHGPTAVTGTSGIQCGGKHVVKVGDVAGCGAVIISGSPTMRTT